MMAVLTLLCCQEDKVKALICSGIYSIRNTPQLLVHITSPVPSCLPIHSLSVKPQCTENDVPGEAKVSLPFTGGSEGSRQHHSWIKVLSEGLALSPNQSHRLDSIIPT